MDDEEIERNLDILLNFLNTEKEKIKDEVNKFRVNSKQTDEQLLEYVIENVDEDHHLYKRICQYQMTDMYYKKILVEYKVSKITKQVETILTTSLENCCDDFITNNKNSIDDNKFQDSNTDNDIEDNKNQDSNTDNDLDKNSGDNTDNNLTEKEKQERKKVIKKIEDLFDKKFDAFLNKCKEDVFKQIQESIDDMVNTI